LRPIEEIAVAVDVVAGSSGASSFPERAVRVRLPLSKPCGRMLRVPAVAVDTWADPGSDDRPDLEA